MRKWIFIFVAVLLIVPIVLVGAVLYTPAGLSLVASQLHRLEPMGIRIEGVSGRLSGPLYIRRFELDKPNVHIVSHDIVAGVRIRELVLQTIAVRSLRARDTVVEVRSSPTPPGDKPMRFLPSFMRVDVRGIELSEVRYVNIDGTPVDATTLRGSVRIGPRRLRIREFQVEAPRFNLAGNGRMLAQRPLALELKVSGDTILDRGTQIAGSAQATGTLDQLAIQATVLRPDVVNVDAMFTRPENRWRVEGNVASPAISLQPWMEKPPFSFRNVALKVDARPSGIRASGNIGVPEWSARDFTIDVQGRYAKRVLEIPAAQVTVNDSPMRVNASGAITFDGDSPTLDVSARWNDMQWPLEGRVLVRSSQGNATLKGPLPYDYTLDARVTLPENVIRTSVAMEAHAQAQGVLDRDGFTMSEYVVQALNGSLAGRGSLQFGQPRAWTLSARAANIDPTQVAPQFGGALSFNLEAHGQGVDKGAYFSAHLDRLSGRLRDQPVRGGGRVQRDRKGWHAQNVRLRFGEARAALDGSVNDSIDIQVEFRARSLETLLPDARGRLEFQGTARGPTRKPRIVGTVQAEALRYAQWQMASLAADGDIDLAGNNPSRLSLTARSIGQSEPFVDALRIEGQGVAARHEILLDVTGTADPASVAPRTKVRVDGQLANQVWSGSLLATDLTLSRDLDETLAMKEPASFVISRDRLLLEKLCLAVGHGQFCADGQWRRNGPWEATVSGYEIPIAIVLPPGGPDADYSGRIEGRVHASGAPGQAWQADAGARIIDAAITYSPQGAAPETLNLGNGGLSATATTERLQFSLGIQAFEDTFLYANARIERDGSNDLLHLPLVGDIRARAADANILPIIFTEVDNAAGLLTANMDVRGTLAAPEVSGRIELANGALDSYRVNFALRELSLIADLANNGLDFRGSGKAGEGQLSVSGDFAWEQGLLRGDLDLKGTDLLVADLPEYRVVASPDLHFRVDGQSMNVAGDVAIPSARIQPVNLSGAVQASDDARYVGETEAERQGRFTVHSEVRIRMGDDVRVDAFGLQGRIVGAVGTTVTTGETAIGRGELSVADGRYEAYGQKLDIARGRLLFDVSPLDDPGLDIEAQRKIENIKVGVNVRGTLRAPRLSFFSDPSMSQNQIVSYLLVGKGIDNMQNSTATANPSASDALALQGGGFLASRLGRELGLEEVGVESSTAASGQTNTSLVLGKFLSPRLFISYGISLTESINTFKLRYTISDKWMLKMEAGEVQSADAEYTIER